MVRALSIPAFALFLSAAAALAEPPPPAAPAPQPMPYPNVSARDPASGLPTGKRMHKPYVVTLERQTIQASAVSWAARALDVGDRLSSDPEEGGEITAAKKTSKPSVSEISVTKGSDVASPKILSAAPGAGNVREDGKIEYPNLQAQGGTDAPPPAGSATVTVARGACASGQHIKDATIVVRSRSFELHDVDVTGCTANADGTDTCTLTYASVSG